MMVEKRILTSTRTGFTDLKYDASTFEIEYIDEIKTFLLRRLTDGEILNIFGDISFIVQHEEKTRTSFVVSEYDSKRKCCILNHYIYNRKGEFYKRMSLKSSSLYLSECAVSKNSYRFDYPNAKKAIYNLCLTSRPFSEIYMDDKIKALLGKNILIVSEEKENDIVKDTITYGINPDTLEVVTPIWSELQQRYIDVYTDEQIAEINLEDIKWKLKYTDNGTITIYMEVERYLQELACHLPQPKKIYTENKKIDKEFVKSFIRNR